MNATFSGKLSLSNIQENQSYTLSGEGQSSVGFANGSADVKLIEENGITTLTYEVNANVGGKIAQLGSRLISGVTKKMSDYFFGRFADIVSPITKKGESLKERFYSSYMQLGVASYTLGNWCTSVSSFKRARKISEIHNFTFPNNFDSAIEYAKSQMELVK